MRSYGISTLAGARWHHWQVTAEYRPWLHIYNWHSDNDNFLTNDLSIKAGFLFGRLHRRPTN